jgi:hypothetical protein
MLLISWQLFQNLDLKNRGFKFIVPIGRMFTQEEERADVRIYFFFIYIERLFIILTTGRFRRI